MHTAVKSTYSCRDPGPHGSSQSSVTTGLGNLMPSLTCIPAMYAHGLPVQANNKVNLFKSVK